MESYDFKDEFMQYGEKMWACEQGAPPSPSMTQLKILRSNMRFSAKVMDADHDGTIGGVRGVRRKKSTMKDKAAYDDRRRHEIFARGTAPRFKIESGARARQRGLQEVADRADCGNRSPLGRVIPTHQREKSCGTTSKQFR
jgi:hypothetical protein